MCIDKAHRVIVGCFVVDSGFWRVSLSSSGVGIFFFDAYLVVLSLNEDDGFSLGECAGSY